MFHLSGELAEKKGLLQRLDPRIKVATLLTGLLMTTLIHRWDILVVVYGATLVLAGLSRLPLPGFLLRTWFFIPVFTAAAALPSMLNIVTPGHPVWTLFRLAHPVAWGLWHWPATIAVTREGLCMAGVLVLRVATAVSWTLLLTWTTRWDRLLRAFEYFRVPQAFLLPLGMMIRYLHILMRETEEMHRAIRSRTIHPATSRTGQQTVAFAVGALLRRSLQWSHQISLAMVARGYTVEAVRRSETR
jgi:cobalt/nickel transport system permease protein